MRPPSRTERRHDRRRLSEGSCSSTGTHGSSLRRRGDSGYDLGRGPTRKLRRPIGSRTRPERAQGRVADPILRDVGRGPRRGPSHRTAAAGVLHRRKLRLVSGAGEADLHRCRSRGAERAVRPRRDPYRRGGEPPAGGRVPDRLDPAVVRFHAGWAGHRLGARRLRARRGVRRLAQGVGTTPPAARVGGSQGGRPRTRRHPEAEADVVIWSVDSDRGIERWNDGDWTGHAQLLGLLRAAGLRPRVEHMAREVFASRWESAAAQGRTRSSSRRINSPGKSAGLGDEGPTASCALGTIGLDVGGRLLHRLRGSLGLPRRGLAARVRGPAGRRGAAQARPRDRLVRTGTPAGGGVGRGRLGRPGRRDRLCLRRCGGIEAVGLGLIAATVPLHRSAGIPSELGCRGRAGRGPGQ